MNHNPVVAGIYSNAIDAAMAKNLLEAEGIKALIADDQAIGMAWQMSIAMGGVKVLVSEDDLSRAEIILASINSHDADQVRQDPDCEEIEDNPAEKRMVIQGLSRQETEETACNDRERLVEAAWKGALISILFLPLQFYVFWMLLKIMSSETVLRPRFVKLAWWTAGVNISALFVLAVVLRYWLSI